jgi:DNA-directed RNA polymerase specialized sigma24 family protein
MTKHQKTSPGAFPGTTLNETSFIWFSQRGDRDTFASLYEMYHGGIHRYILIRMADPEQAEDLTSLVFLRAWENLNTLHLGRSLFAAWLYRIAHNAVIDRYCTGKTVLSLEEAAPLQLSFADESEKKLDI